MHTMDEMEAAFNVAEDFRPGGAAGLARVIDKNPVTFSHEVKETGGAKLGLRTAVKMSKRTGDLRILYAFAAACGQQCIPLPSALAVPGDDVMLALSRTGKELADLVNEVCASLSNDGIISDNELDRITREGGELIAALNHLLGAVRVRNLAGKPAAGQS